MGMFIFPTTVQLACLTKHKHQISYASVNLAATPPGGAPIDLIKDGFIVDGSVIIL